MGKDAEVRRPLSLADQVCLAIVGESPTHGWAIVKLLQPDGELGRIWSLSRALTYRSLDRLAEAGLLSRDTGGRRCQLTLTPLGVRERERWLDTPVAHLRELRTEFLIKLELRHRGGLPVAAFARRQHRLLAEAIEALTAHIPHETTQLWRYESARAADRFLRQLGGIAAA